MKYLIAGFRFIFVLIVAITHVGGIYIVHLIGLYTVKRGFVWRASWGLNMARAMGFRIVEKRVNHYDGPALYVSNHRTLTDPVVQVSLFPAYIIAKDEVRKIPIIGKGAALTGIIFVKRERLSSRGAAKIATIDCLKDGKSVLVYPEGTTTAEKGTDQFKIGTFKSAVEAGVPVIPCAIEYRDKKDYWLEASMSDQIIGQMGGWSTEVKVSVGKPIFGNDPKGLMETSQKLINEELARMQKGWTKVF